MRAEGYYWVKFPAPGGWEIVRYRNGVWNLPNIEVDFPELAKDIEIDERLIVREEPKSIEQQLSDAQELVDNLSFELDRQNNVS